MPLSPDLCAPVTITLSLLITCISHSSRYTSPITLISRPTLSTRSQLLPHTRLVVVPSFLSEIGPNDFDLLPAPATPPSYWPIHLRSPCISLSLGSQRSPEPYLQPEVGRPLWVATRPMSSATPSATPCPPSWFVHDTTPLRDIRELSPDSDDDSAIDFDTRDDITRLDDDSESERELSDLEEDLFDRPYAPQVILSHPPLAFEPQSSLSASQRHTQQLALAAGFCAVTSRSCPITGRCLMTCVRGGRGGNHHAKYPTETPRHTSKCDCPWSVLWRRETNEKARLAGRGQEDRLWFPHVPINSHNHEPQRGIDVAYLRRLSRTPDVEAAIRRHLAARLEIVQIVRLIQAEHPEALVTRTDVRNIRHHHDASLRAGRSATEAAVERLKDAGDLFKAWRNDAGELCGLVLTTAEARAMTHMYPTVLFIDCTFRTNRYRLPMIHICGFTATNQTYTAAIGFLSRGAEQWYDLAIAAFLDLMGIAKTDIKVIITDREDALTNAIDGLLPHVHRLSCRWHLRENIKLAAKPCFADLEDWKDKLSAYGNFWLANIANAASQDALDDGLAALRRKWNGERYDRANAYIQTMVDDIKDLFVSASIDRHRHLGQTSNSRLEGAHRAFKRELRGAHNDLYHVLEHAKTFMSEQIASILERMGRQRLQRQCHLLRMFDKVRQRISWTALSLMTAQYQRAKAWETDPDSKPECTGRFWASHGLPCAHHFARNMDRLVSITAIDRHWRLLNPTIWDDTVATITSQVAAGIPEGTFAVHQLSGPDWEVDNDTNVIRDPHLRQNRFRAARRAAAAAHGPSEAVTDGPGPLTIAPPPSLAAIEPPHDDPILADTQLSLFEERPVRDRSPRRGERSTASQVIADIDSNTGRLHTRAEKQLGKRKATRRCCFCPKRHRPHSCSTGRELMTRDKDAWTVRVADWDAGEDDDDVDGGDRETKRRLATLESTIKTFMEMMAARDRQGMAVEMETVTTRARMVSDSPWMASTGPWMASTGPWMASTGSWATPNPTPAMAPYGLHSSVHSVRNGNIATQVPYDSVPPLSRLGPPVQSSHLSLPVSQLPVQAETSRFYQGCIQGGIS